MGSIRANVDAVRERMRHAERRAGRTEGATVLLAATKSVDSTSIAEAVSAGVKIIGENRVQEAESKMSDLPEGVEYHMIGHLQSNKVRTALKLFDCIQSVDSKKIAELVAAEALRLGHARRVMLEVNVAGEASKGGFAPDDLRRDFDEISEMKGLMVEGLMTIPPAVDPEAARPYFKQIAGLARELFVDRPAQLSMGMSHDLEVAIEEGATIVRVGTAIFGVRT